MLIVLKSMGLDIILYIEVIGGTFANRINRLPKGLTKRVGSGDDALGSVSLVK